VLNRKREALDFGAAAHLFTAFLAGKKKKIKFYLRQADT
jgi:hypothetical protein